jgi:hypothetical protein
MISSDRIETPNQLAERVGLPERQVRDLLNTGPLEYGRVGKRKLIPTGAWQRFLDQAIAKDTSLCRDETKAPVYVGSTNDRAITSSGQKTIAAASATLARQNANKLKSLARMIDLSRGSILVPAHLKIPNNDSSRAEMLKYPSTREATRA